jgi:hypothetical protein
VTPPTPEPTTTANCANFTGTLELDTSKYALINPDVNTNRIFITEHMIDGGIEYREVCQDDPRKFKLITNKNIVQLNKLPSDDSFEEIANSMPPLTKYKYIPVTDDLSINSKNIYDEMTSDGWEDTDDTNNIPMENTFLSRDNYLIIKYREGRTGPAVYQIIKQKSNDWGWVLAVAAVLVVVGIVLKYNYQNRSAKLGASDAATADTATATASTEN